jgi:hypothetical protein
MDPPVEHDGDIIGFFSQTQLFEAAQAVVSHGGVHMPMIGRIL